MKFEPFFTQGEIVQRDRSFSLRIKDGSSLNRRFNGSLFEPGSPTLDLRDNFNDPSDEFHYSPPHPSSLC
jgi:hypothetical protein